MLVRNNPLTSLHPPRSPPAQSSAAYFSTFPFDRATTESRITETPPRLPTTAYLLRRHRRPRTNPGHTRSHPCSSHPQRSHLPVPAPNPPTTCATTTPPASSTTLSSPAPAPKASTKSSSSTSATSSPKEPSATYSSKKAACSSPRPLP